MSSEVHLTADDTWCIWLDSARIRTWLTVVDEKTVDCHTEAGIDEIGAWSVDVIDDLSSRRFTVDHETVVAAMCRIAWEPMGFWPAIVARVTAVANAADHDDARAEACLLDPVDCDAIIQIATLGKVIY